MSGGSLNYFYSQLEDHVGDFEDKELDELVKDLAELFHDREWYLSADTGIGSWREARDAFKDKWFSEHGRQKRIERYLEEITDEVREMFGISNERCETCKHWEQREESVCYGRCDFEKHCLMHRSEKCRKWEEIEWDA